MTLLSFQSNIPHCYATIDIKIDKLNDARSKLLMEDVKVSVNDFIIKAVAHALLECPDVNTLFQNGQVIIRLSFLFNITCIYKLI